MDLRSYYYAFVQPMEGKLDLLAKFENSLFNSLSLDDIVSDQHESSVIHSRLGHNRELIVRSTWSTLLNFYMEITGRNGPTSAILRFYYGPN